MLLCEFFDIVLNLSTHKSEKPSPFITHCLCNKQFPEQFGVVAARRADGF